MSEKDDVNEKEKINSLIKELIEKRKAYVVSSILGRGTKSPEGRVNPGHNCRDVGAMTSDEGKYYGALFYSADKVSVEANLPLFLLSASFADAVLPSRATHGDVGRINAADYQMLCSYCSSGEEGYSELTISGLSGSFDTRTTLVSYEIVQKVPTNILEQLWPVIHSNPLLIEQIYQTGFPKLDSDINEFNGLYRFKANRVLLIEPTAVETWIASNRERLEESTRDGDVNIRKAKVLRELSQSGKVLDFGKEVGVGTVDHFSQLKKVANDEMNRKNQERDDCERQQREQNKRAKIEAEKERRAGLNPLQRVLEDIFGK